MITVILLSFDILASVLAFAVSYYLRNFGPFRIFLYQVQPLRVYLQALPFAILLLISIFYVSRLYEPKQRLSKIGEFYTTSRSITLWALLIMAASYFTKYDYSRIIVVLYFILSLFFVNLSRFLVQALQNKLARKGIGVTNVLIVGAGRVGRGIAKRLEDYNRVGFNLVGFVDGKAKPREGLNILGDLSYLANLIKTRNIDEVYISDPTLSHREILNVIASFGEDKVKFKVVSNVFDLVTGNVEIYELEKIPSLDIKRTSPTLPFLLVKRLFDILFSLLFLVLTAPLWIIIVLLILLESPGSVILCQGRIGYKGKRFKIYKFRTMRQETSLFAEPPKNLADSRITKMGRWLRKTSLDELPQFLNILKGEMSVVGPRPEMPFMVKGYEAWQWKRFDVKPGLTGLWQILGRKDLPLSENIEYDFYYINNQSLFLDFVIILKTIPVVLFGKGAY